MEQPWYKNAIFYSLDVETYYDSNGDGIGDFQGLIQKLDCIAALGIQCLWLLPFYPSPNRDNGYDVTDYCNVDTRLGTLADFAQLMNKAEALGLRILIDLVVNHTSVDHPWFQAARTGKDSPYRDYYVWSDEPLAFEKEHLILQGEESTVWTFDEQGKQYYLHRFYKWQPDLNISNPKVKEEILKIMTFWLRLGVHGFRIDAAEMLIDPYGLKGAGEEELIGFINQMRDHAQTQRKDALLLAEVNAGPEQLRKYLQGNERMNMLFNFYANQHLFLALATEDKQALVRALEALPETGKEEQWLHFLRHHDELNLRLLAKKDQENVLTEFAPEENMRIYGSGIRRRLAPMMNGDLRRLKLAYSLLFSLPGTQMIRYGDEIGMSEDLSLPGRASVRTPMQWSPAPNGGFSKAPNERLVHPVVSGGAFGFETVNVLAAQQQPGSLLNWLEQLIRTRRQCPEIGAGKLTLIPFSKDNLLVHSYEWQGKKLFLIHNLSNGTTQVPKRNLTEETVSCVFGEQDADNNEVLHVAAYGYRWLRTE